MMGQHARSESLFYYFKLDDYIPESHLLRRIDKHISFAFVREQLEGQLQRYGTTVDRSRTAAADPADRLPVRHHQRAQVGGRAAHAPGLALVHRAGIRSGDAASLRPSPRTGTDGFRSRSCSSSFSNRSCSSAWRWGWCAGTTSRWTEVWSRPMPPRRAGFREPIRPRAAQVNLTLRQYFLN